MTRIGAILNAHTHTAHESRDAVRAATALARARRLTKAAAR